MNISTLDKLRKEVDDEINDRKKDLQNGKLDMSFGELSNMFNEGDLIIRPEFQRLFRWNNYQKTRLIESILVGIPIPSIFVVENDKGQWELIDGLQRLSTVFSFMGKLNNNEQWKLGEGDILHKIKGLSYDDLPTRARSLIRRYICRVEIIYYGSDYDIRYDIFERLNTGGSPLSDQEIRNAIYRNDFPNFVEFLSRNGSNNKFIELINISTNKQNSLYADELVLRFCSLYDSNGITKNLSNHMDSYMKKIIKMKDINKINELEDIFKRTINVLTKLNIDNLFWKKPGFSSTLYDGIMIGLSMNIEKYENESCSTITDKIEELKNDENFEKYSGSKSHNAKNVNKRILIAKEIFGTND